MKYFCLTVFGILLISLVSCRKAETDQELTPTNPELEKFIGNWETSEFYYDSVWYDIDDYSTAEAITIFDRIELLTQITVRRDNKYPKDYIGDAFYNYHTTNDEIKYLINTNDSISFTPNCEACYFYEYKFKYEFISDSEVELTSDYIFKPIKMVKK